MTICPAGAKLFYAGGRTNGLRDRHDVANSSFPQYCERA